MTKRKKDKVEDLVGQLIKNELEAQLARLVRKAKRKATREAGKLNEVLRLEYHKGEGFVEAEVIEPQSPGIEDREIKKTEDGSQG